MTVRKLMAVVALLGVALAAFRMYFSVGSFVAGALSIAWIETMKEIKRRETNESPSQLMTVVRIFLASLACEAVVLLICLIPAWLLGPSLLSHRAPFFLAPLHCHATSYNSPYMEWWLAISAACAVIVFRMIHLWWSPRPSPPSKGDPDERMGPR